MNYISHEELSAIRSIIEWIDEAEYPVSIEVKVIDSNGDALGTVKSSDVGAAFFPNGSEFSDDA